MVTRRALVTTALGTIGAHLVRELRELGFVVRAARCPHETSTVPDVEWVSFDYAENESMAAASEDVDVAFLNMPEGFPKGAERLCRAVDILKDKKVKKVVPLSNILVESDPTSAHFLIEQHVKESGLRWSIVRPCFFMQNFIIRQRDAIVKEKALRLPAGEGRVAFVDARDIAAVIAQTMFSESHDNKIYEVTGPEALSHYDIAKTLSDVLGTTVTFDDMHPDEFKSMLLSYGVSESLAEFTTFLYNIVVRQGLVSKVTDHVQEVTKRPPRSFRSFAIDHRARWI